MNIRTLLAGLAVFVATASVASADVITTYTSKAAWIAAVGGPFTTEDFSDGITPGFSFSSTGGGHSGFGISGGHFNDRLVPGSTTKFTFDSPIFAYGGNWDLRPGGAGLGIKVFSGATLVGTEIADSSAGGFFGFVTDTPVTMVTLRTGTQGGSAETYDMDNMVFANSSVPEPASALLLGLGLAFAARRRKRKTS